MLKNIPPILSPELLKVLAEMGHGDRICIGDGNFPGASMAKPNNCVFLRADGHGVPELLDAILQVIPLDEYVEHPVMIMQVAEKDRGMEIPIWDEYKKIVAKYDARGEAAFGSYERFEFYDEARKTYCILQSGETAIYANVICRRALLNKQPAQSSLGHAAGAAFVPAYYFFSALACSSLCWRRLRTASSIGWISPAACRAILVSSGPTSS